MRARNIKPGFYTDELLLKLDPIVRILFTGLWGIADRRGLVPDRPGQIQIDVVPRDSIDVDAALDELVGAEKIVRYVGSNGVKTIKILNFAKHQRPHIKEPANPNLVEPGTITCEPGTITCEPALNPESGILNPESLMRIPDSGFGRAHGPVDQPDSDADLIDVSATLAPLLGAFRMNADDLGRPTEPPTTSVAHRGAQEPQEGAAREAAFALARHRAKLDPSFRASGVIEDWAIRIAQLHSHCNRTYAEISEVMRWCFETSQWWGPRILNAADFVKSYERIRGQWQSDQMRSETPTPVESDPQQLRPLFESLDFEVAEGGPEHARKWIAKQPERWHHKLTKRLDKITASGPAQGVSA